ncbi:hypothetical protein M2146_001067 [Lachnospiraceae bacterium PF1-22]
MKIINKIIDKKTTKSIPQDFLMKIILGGAGGISILIISLITLIQGQKKLASFIAILGLLCLALAIQYGYYSFTGKWQLIEGEVVFIQNQLKVKKKCDVLIQCGDELYQLALPNGRNLCEVGMIARIITPETTAFYTRNNIKQISVILSKKFLAPNDNSEQVAKAAKKFKEI